ncbi:MAG TPA: CDP-alcohol phosphatidyltransferase family protein [Balneolaceae bacterium]|nr:CDP-alcohol phosphatidyltransferase family protein [Balneolaceae bacterium]
MNVRSAFFTWSNLISFSRVFVAIPIIWLHQNNGHHITWGIGMLVLYGIFSDYLDGFIARKTDTISEWGKILDPFADKFTALLLFLYTVMIGYIPLWFLIVEILRDLVIVSGSLFIRKLRGSVPMSVMSGKWSVNALSAYWMSAFFLPNVLWLKQFWLGCTLALMLFSLIDYLHRFKQIKNGLKLN